jgi:hypothetical protein
MPVRKSVEETLVVDGPRAEWVEKSRAALEAQGFGKVEANATLGQVTATYRKLTVAGELVVTLTPEGDEATRIVARATAGVDNVFALFSSPGQRIINQFKAGLA